MITPPPIAVDDAGTRHSALLAANDARNAANAACRAELVNQALVIAARAASSESRSAAATVVRAPLQDRLAALVVKHAGEDA